MNENKQILKIEDRSLLSVNGITGLREFSETEVVFETGDDLLYVGGAGLCVTRLTLETGESAVTGRIDSAVFSRPAVQKTFISRLFGRHGI
ncbi:MAG: YabP/YqfC family sporulation protein [Clostridia bacterium]|nr:YabP/YqfC family sporulation protein [Clostridia bacterium]MBQ6182916.1 YabP/YqfC family sporulation protein [Clostridia bacterium]